MPNLSYAAAAEWLRGRDPVAAALAGPGHIDRVDGGDAAVARLGATLDAAMAFSPEAVSAALTGPGARTLMGQIGLTRRLRILEWVREADLPDWRGVQDALADGEELLALRRLELLDEMFSPERLAELGAASAKKGDAE